MTLWMGSEFAEHTWQILTLLAFGSLLGSLTTVPNLVTMGLGYSRIVGMFSIVSLGFYLVLIPLLTSWFGLMGNGWAIVVSTLPGLLLVGFELRRIFRVALMQYWNEALGIRLIPVVLLLSSVICGTMPDPYHPSLPAASQQQCSAYILDCWLSEVIFQSGNGEGNSSNTNEAQEPARAQSLSFYLGIAQNVGKTPKIC